MVAIHLYIYPSVGRGRPGEGSYLIVVDFVVLIVEANGGECVSLLLGMGDIGNLKETS